MNCILIFSIIMALLTACVPTKAVSNSPMNIPTPTPIPAIATTTPTETPTPEPTKTIAELGYMVKVGEIECNLNQHSDENPDIFLAECPEIIYMPLHSTIEIELITPSGETYELHDAENILADFANDAILGEFVPMNENNLAGCAIPYKDIAGEEIICEFSFTFAEERLSLIIEGITARLTNTSHSSGDTNTGASVTGEEGPPGGDH